MYNHITNEAIKASVQSLCDLWPTLQTHLITATLTTNVTDWLAGRVLHRPQRPDNVSVESQQKGRNHQRRHCS